MTILDTVADLNLFAPLFRPATTWAAWWAFLATVFGLPMDAATLDVYRRHTGRTAPPTLAAREAWVIAGRDRRGRASSRWGRSYRRVQRRG